MRRVGLKELCVVIYSVLRTRQGYQSRREHPPLSSQSAPLKHVRFPINQFGPNWGFAASLPRTQRHFSRRRISPFCGSLPGRNISIMHRVGCRVSLAGTDERRKKEDGSLLSATNGYFVSIIENRRVETCIKDKKQRKKRLAQRSLTRAC